MKVAAATLIGIILLAIPLFGTGSGTDEITLALIQFIAALGLAVAFGMAGELVVCQASLLGLGGYVFGYARLHHGASFVSALLWAAAAGAVAGAFLGLAAIRVHGHYFAILTLAVAVVVYEAVIRFDAFTGGAVGLYDIPPLTGVLASSAAYYVLVAAVAVLLALYVALLQHTPLGRALLAAGRSAGLAAASGIDVSRLKVVALFVSGTFAALAGGLHVQFMTAFAPENVSVQRSIVLLLIAALAGRSSVPGVAVATWLAEIVPGYLRIVGELRFAILGGIILLVILAAPAGIGLPLERLFDRAMRFVSTETRRA